MEKINGQEEIKAYFEVIESAKNVISYLRGEKRMDMLSEDQRDAMICGLLDLIEPVTNPNDLP